MPIKSNIARTTLKKIRNASLLFSLIVLVACGGTEKKTSGGSTSGGSTSGGSTSGGSTSGGAVEDKQAKLVADVAGIMQKSYADLHGSTDALNNAIAGYCGALGKSDEQAKRTEAQAAFKTAMNDLQHSLLYGVGPALKNDRMLQLYSWPLSSACQIDIKLASNQVALNKAVNKRGMDALEYLLFIKPDANHSCPKSGDTLTTFNALSPAQKQQRRCEYMKPVAIDALASTKILADAWDASKGNYVKTMKDEANTKKTLNSITDGMFYFEEVIKENKLDAPLGGKVANTASSCGLGNLCPQGVESPHALISKENLRANMLALQTLYKAGFDSWLKDNKKDDLAKKFADDIQAVITGLDGINGTLYAAITTETTALNNLLAGPVQDVSKALRFKVLPALELSLPKTSESDTD